MSKPFNRTRLRQCRMTMLCLPETHFPPHSEFSVLGLLFVNVSSRAVNGRYSGARRYAYPSNSHHRNGIRMYEPWVDDPTLFGSDIITHLGAPLYRDGEKLTLDRIDNSGDYVIENLRWATHHEQAMNRGVPGQLEDHEVTYRV